MLTITPFAKTQRNKILALLLERRGWVPTPEIASIALQYSARILELRRAGYVIENKLETTETGAHSWFRLVGPEPAPAVPVRPSAPPQVVSKVNNSGQLPLFGARP